MSREIKFRAWLLREKRYISVARIDLHFEYTDGQDYYKDVEEVRYNSEGCLIPFAFKYECDGCDLRYEITSIEVIGNIHQEKENKQ